MPRGSRSGRIVRFFAVLGVFVALALGFSQHMATAVGGSINGTVYDDLNNDGAMLGEGGHGAVTVFIDTNANGVLDGGERSTTTDGSGSYSFSNVADGTYSVRAVVPASYGATSPNPVTVIVNGSANVLNVNIGISNVGAVSGYVFNDNNGNGNQDAADGGLSGKIVFIDSNGNGSYSTGEPQTTTDSNGFYSFTGLSASTSVTIRATIPGTATRTTPNPNAITVTPGLSQTHVDFGLFTYGSLAGTVYNDVNADGIKAVSDSGVNARTVYCDLNGNNIKDAGEPFAATNAAGLYTIVNLGPMSCAPRLVQATGTVQTTTDPSTFTVSSGLNVTGDDFGSFTLGSITGFVFSDSNADGAKQTAEGGLSGKTVYLDANNNGTLDVGETNVNTNGTGQYTFSNVGPGTYNVRAVNVPNSTPTSSAVMVVGMTSAQSAAGTNFGFFINASISGQVYEDKDGAGTLSAGESGLTGRTVFIDANSNDTLDAGETTTTTNSTGNYTFSGLTPGTYRIRVDIPNGWMRTSTNPVPITPTSGGTNSANFGLFQLASIGGSIFDDTNGDGLKQAGEAGRSGVTVFLDTNNNNTFDVGEASSVSLADGTFSIGALGPGTYKARLVMPVGSSLTTALPASVTTTSGMASTSSTFGLFANVIISGSVYGDFDGDGSREAGEAGLAGKLVFLDANNDGILTTGETTTTTDSSGNYSFTNLGPGTYRPRVNLTAGVLRTSANPANVIAISGANVPGQDFGLFATATISGSVFNDVNANGNKDAGDAGLTPRTVYVDSNNNGALDTGESSVTTGTGGVYTLTGLGPGTFQVRVVIPANVVQTSTNPAAVSTTAGSVSIANDFGLFTLGSITGSVYDDKNGNAAKQPNEPVLAGRTVYLDMDNSGTFDTGEPTALTSGTGTYTFTGLVAGTYRVRLQELAGVTQTTPVPTPIVVTSGINATSVDFGTFALAIITGQVYDDVAGNATLNTPGDLGMPGITVFFDTNSNGVVDTGETTVTTDSNGVYTFPNVGPGSYNVRAVYPASVYQTTTILGAIAPTSGGTSAGNNIGLFTYGVISGSVFMDDNGNGVKDTGEVGVPNVRVYSDNNSGNSYTAGEPTVLTDAAGNYSLGSLKNGSYKMRVVLASGQVLSTDIPDPTTVQSKSNVISMDFGIFLQGTISGVVYNDVNGNKTRDTGEVSLGAKTVYIDANNNGKKDATEKSVVSSATGAYSFTGLGPGPFTVLIVVPAGQTQTSDNPAPIALQSGQTSTLDWGMRDSKLTGGGTTGGSTGGGTTGGGTTGGSTGGTTDGATTPTPTDAYSANSGYWMASAEGGVFAYGNAPFLGSAVPFKPNKPIVGLAPTPTNKGYYLVATDGGIFSFGDAQFYGSMGGSPLNKPMVGMAATPSGKGYWTVASDGGIFAYGDAKFYGSTGSMTLNKPIVGMQSTPSGQGYWLVASDGGIFAYGDAKFYGSTGSINLNKPIVAMARSKDGLGYWLVASDGGVFAYGNATFLGSTGGTNISGPIVDARATANGDGYWMFGRDGGVYNFGASQKYGEKPDTKSPIVS